MTTWHEQMERHEKVVRGLRTAATWVRKGGWFAIDELATEHEVERFLSSALDAIEMVVRKRPPKAYFFADGEDGISDMVADALGSPRLRGWTEDYGFEQLLKTAENIVDLLREQKQKGHRIGLIEKLESTEGRSPEESALYLARAARMRQEDGLPPRG